MTKNTKKAVSCYLDQRLVDRYDELEGNKPTLSTLLDYALTAYLEEVSEEEQLCLKVLSVNAKIRAGLATHKSKSMTQEIPKTITITMDITAASRVLDTLTAAIDMSREVRDQAVLVNNLIATHAIIWNHYVDQIVSIAQPDLYKLICEQRKNGSGDEV